MVITTATMTVAGGGTTGIITVHRTLTSFKPCAETPDQYHRRYPCDQQEGRKVFESADSSHRSSFSIAGRWNCVSSCLDPTRTADLRAVSPLLAAATHIPAVASPTDAPKIKPACRSVNYVAVPWCWNAIRPRIQLVSATAGFGSACFDCSLAISSSHTSLGVL